jgi:hypothetical protein
LKSSAAGTAASPTSSSCKPSQAPWLPPAPASQDPSEEAGEGGTDSPDSL